MHIDCIFIGAAFQTENVEVATAEARTIAAAAITAPQGTPPPSPPPSPRHNTPPPSPRRYTPPRSPRGRSQSPLEHRVHRSMCDDPATPQRRENHGAGRRYLNNRGRGRRGGNEARRGRGRGWDRGRRSHYRRSVRNMNERGRGGGYEYRPMQMHNSFSGNCSIVIINQ